MHDLLDWLVALPTAAWVAVSGVASALGSWAISVKTLRVAIARERDKVMSETAATENAERALFRTTLMSDIQGLRLLIKECEIDRTAMRARIVATEEQLIVQQGSNEIMQRWIAFFRSQGAANLPDLPASVLATLRASQP